MNMPAPKIDKRTFEDLVLQIQALLEANTGTWKPPHGRRYMDRGGALARLAARLAETLLARVNRAPDMNLVAFLDTVGISRLPPRASQAPLTFDLAEGAMEEPVVALGTQASALASAGAEPAVIFETEANLTTTRSVLKHVYALLPAIEEYADATAIATGLRGGGFFAFSKNPEPPARRVSHWIAIGGAALAGGPSVKQYTVTFTPTDPGQTEAWNYLLHQSPWYFRQGVSWCDTSLQDDNEFEVELTPLPNAVSAELPELPRVLEGVPAGWLVAFPPRLDEDDENNLRKLAFSNVQYALTIAETGQALTTALANESPIDLGRPFYPFGEEPQTGDCFYLNLGNTLPVVASTGSEQGIHEIYGAELIISFSVVLSKPGIATEVGDPPTATDIVLVWEYWNVDAGQWMLLGQSNTEGAISTDNPHGLVDGTDAFTNTTAGDLTISFACPGRPGRTRVLGETGHWIRVMIQTGGYGLPATYVKKDGDYVYEDATLAPPMITTMTCGADNSANTPPALEPDDLRLIDSFRSVDVTNRLVVPDADPPVAPRPQTVITTDQAAATDRQLPILVYQPLASRDPALYAGFERPGDEIGFANREVSIYFDLQPNLWGNAGSGGGSTDSKTSADGSGRPGADATHIPAVGGARDETDLAMSDPSSALLSSEVRWQYCAGGENWRELGVHDGTHGLTRAGIVRFIGPVDFYLSEFFGERAFWLRAMLVRGKSSAVVGRIAPNTVRALNAQSVREEVLGSSSGEPDQRFFTSRIPVLAGQIIQVREKEMPTLVHASIIREQAGSQAILPAGETGEYWVQWRQVPDFYGSGPSSRHYVFDYETGGVIFGDGQAGLIPPSGRDNIRAASYAFGGGRAGNSPVGSITQLRTTIPGVVSVTNVAASEGGAGMETLQGAVSRGPTLLRTRDRAVAAQDYIDLVMQNFRNVARIGCEQAKDIVDAGKVTLVVVPDSANVPPAPSMELLSEISDFLYRRMPVAMDPKRLKIIGPNWVRIDVTADVVPKDMNQVTEVQSAVITALNSFLDPIGGGPHGQGWPFGEEPLRSQVVAAVERVPGVDYVRGLRLSSIGRRRKTFMITPGAHEVVMSSAASDDRSGAVRSLLPGVLGSDEPR